MNVNDQYAGLRMKMVFLSLLCLLLCFLVFRLLLPDYLLNEKDLRTETGIIKSIYKNKRGGMSLVKGRTYQSTLDIELVNKPYFIRLSDHLIDQYWPAINQPGNINRTIELKFQERFLHDHMLENPNQVAINGQVVIPYNTNRSFTGWFMATVIAVILVAAWLLYTSFITYRNHLFKQDKKLWQKSKWELILAWLKD